MRLGVIDMIGLATTLIFALPLGKFGIAQLLAGETAMGIALVGVAVAMVAVPHYILDPRAIITKLLKGLLPRRLRNLSTNEGENPPETEQ